jgi:hypothetical protein
MAGTAFWYKQENAVYLVTNRHILKPENDYPALHAYVHARTPKGDISPDIFFQVSYRDNHQKQILCDDSHDLCAIPQATLKFDPVQRKGRGDFPLITSKIQEEVYIVAFEEEHVRPPEELDDLEEVFMIGCPSILWDDFNVLPLIRRGYTAISPRVRWQNGDDGVVDIAAFNGSSGSPVFVYSKRGTLTYNPAKALPDRDYIALLGVLYGGPSHVAEVLNKDGETVGNRFVKVPNNLGFYIKAEVLRDLVSRNLPRTSGKPGPPRAKNNKDHL